MTGRDRHADRVHPVGDQRRRHSFAVGHRDRPALRAARPSRAAVQHDQRDCPGDRLPRLRQRRPAGGLLMAPPIPGLRPPVQRQGRTPADIAIGVLAVVLLAALTIGVPAAPGRDHRPADTEVGAVDVRAHRPARRADDPEDLVGRRVAGLAAARLVRDRGDPGGRPQRGRARPGAAVRRHPVRRPPARDRGAAAVQRGGGALPGGLAGRRAAAPGLQRLRPGAAARPGRGSTSAGGAQPRRRATGAGGAARRTRSTW